MVDQRRDHRGRRHRRRRADALRPRAGRRLVRRLGRRAGQPLVPPGRDAILRTTLDGRLQSPRRIPPGRPAGRPRPRAPAPPRAPWWCSMPTPAPFVPWSAAAPTAPAPTIAPPSPAASPAPRSNPSCGSPPSSTAAARTTWCSTRLCASATGARRISNPAGAARSRSNTRWPSASTPRRSGSNSSPAARRRWPTWHTGSASRTACRTCQRWRSAPARWACWR